MDTRLAVVLAGLAGPFLMIAPVEAAVPTCDGRRATIVGTAADDTLRGTTGADVIAGLGGDDTIHGLGGRDRICGGYGADRLYGGHGRDRVFGGMDKILINDELSRERIGDQLRGGPSSDRLVPGRDPRPAVEVTQDVLSWDRSPRGVRIDIRRGVATGDGADSFAPAGATVQGSRFADRIVGSGRGERMLGGAGADFLAGRGGNDVIHDGSGDDVSRGGYGDDEVSGGAGFDDLRGGPGADTVSDSTHGANRLDGSAGDDLVVAQLSSQAGSVHDGGDGSDRLALLSSNINSGGATSTGTWNMSSGLLRFTGPTTAAATVLGFEDVDLTTFGTSWDITGSPTSEAVDAGSTRGTRFVARGGDDTFWGSPQDDVLDGGAGTDRAVGMGEGTDTCVSVEQPADCEVVTP